MTEVERAILAQYHKQIKLAKIWRAIARRRATVIYQLAVWPGYITDMDGETDP